jgi:hypothetical protein
MLTNQVDYSFNYYKVKDEAAPKEVREQYNPYVNNSGTVMGIFIFNFKLSPARIFLLLPEIKDFL